MASARGDFELVRYMVDNGANVNPRITYKVLFHKKLKNRLDFDIKILCLKLFYTVRMNYFLYCRIQWQIM